MISRKDFSCVALPSSQAMMRWQTIFWAFFLPRMASFSPSLLSYRGHWYWTKKISITFPTAYVFTIFQSSNYYLCKCPWPRLSVCLSAISSQTAGGIETWMVPCCHKLSGACFKPLRFTKSSQKSSKKAKTSRAPCSTLVIIKLQK